MSYLSEAAYAAELAPSRARLLARMLPAAELLPVVVGARDAKGAEVLLARRTKAELHALVVILASWVAEAEAARSKAETAAQAATVESMGEFYAA